MSEPTTALYRAMCAVDNDDPGAFNIVGISEPDTRPVAEAVVAALSRSGYVIVPTESRALLLDELEAAVRGLELYGVTREALRDAVLALFQQHREAIR